VAKAEARSRHFGEERTLSKSFGILYDSHPELSGWPLLSSVGPLHSAYRRVASQWAFDIAGGSKPAYPPGPAFLRGAWQVPSYSPVGVVRAVTRRSVCRVDDCYGWPTGAHHNRAASSRWEA
jgi:hypothetical protein